MEQQLTKNGLSSEDAVISSTQTSIPETARISEEELQALLAGTRTGFLHQPVPRRIEIYAGVAVRIFVDLMAILGATWLAYWLRFENGFMVSSFPPQSVPAFNNLAFALIAWSPFLLLSLKLCGMYNTRTRLRTLDKIPRIFGAVNAYIISFLLISFLLDIPVMARGYIVFFWGLCVLFILAGRTILLFLLSMAGISDTIIRNTLIVGSGNVGKDVARKLIKHNAFGLNPVGFVDDDPLYTKFEEPELRNLRVLGGLKDIYPILKDFEVEKVVIAFSNTTSEQLLDLTSKCNEMGVECSIVPRLFEVITNEIMVNEIGGIPLVRLREKKIEGINHVLKTIEDYVLGTVILLFALPLLIATSIAIKLDSPGPVFFRQKRMGKNGKCFNCLKFRSMVENAEDLQGEIMNLNEAEGPLFKIRKDPRITRVGKWIRKSSLDELPQIFNVLAGQMSLVGPRPPIPEEVIQYKEWHKQRLNVRPGITGLWQVNGRSNSPYDEMIKYDLYYIERWSLWLDVKIMLRTVSAVFKCDGAC
ncbi:MAG: sugar transferase [Actinomycetota bacterium]|nr:sugar transferase [Actinomycetota bacterium]